MTAKKKSQWFKWLLGIGSGVVGLLIGSLLLNIGQGAVAGNQAGKDIIRVEKKIDEHVTCHQVFEQSIKMELSKKVDNNRMDRLENSFDRMEVKIDNLLVGQKAVVKTSNLRVKNSHYGYGVQLDTTNY